LGTYTNKAKNNNDRTETMNEKHCKIGFGTYVQVHEKHNKSMEPRTSGTIEACWKLFPELIHEKE